jgi:hypothetical protein
MRYPLRKKEETGECVLLQPLAEPRGGETGLLPPLSKA